MVHISRSVQEGSGPLWMLDPGNRDLAKHNFDPDGSIRGGDKGAKEGRRKPEKNVNVFNISISKPKVLYHIYFKAIQAYTFLDHCKVRARWIRKLKGKSLKIMDPFQKLLLLKMPCFFGLRRSVKNLRKKKRLRSCQQIASKRPGSRKLPFGAQIYLKFCALGIQNLHWDT